MTRLYPCNPHYTSRSPGSDQLENAADSSYKYLNQRLQSSTSVTKCSYHSVCLSVCLQAIFLMLPLIKAKVSWQKLQGRKSFLNSEKQRSKKAHSKPLLVQGLGLVTQCSGKLFLVRKGGIP